MSGGTRQENAPTVFPLTAAIEKMVLIRTVEESFLDLFKRGEISGTTHTCVGQEANAVGVAMALRPTDLVVSNHRGHGHFLAHVDDTAGLFAELLGRADGVWSSTVVVFQVEQRSRAPERAIAKSCRIPLPGQ